MPAVADPPAADVLRGEEGARDRDAAGPPEAGTPAVLDRLLRTVAGHLGAAGERAVLDYMLTDAESARLTKLRRMRRSGRALTEEEEFDLYAHALASDCGAALKGAVLQKRRDRDGAER